MKLVVNVWLLLAFICLALGAAQPLIWQFVGYYGPGPIQGAWQTAPPNSNVMEVNWICLVMCVACLFVCGICFDYCSRRL